MAVTAERMVGAARRVVLGLWGGAGVFLGVVALPAVFSTLRVAPLDRRPPAPSAMAGDVALPMLTAMSWVSAVAAVLVLMSLGMSGGGARARVLGWLTLVGLGCALFNLGWLMPVMLDILAQMGAPVDALEHSHPLRVRFAGLHGWAGWLGLGMVLPPVLALALDGDDGPVVRRTS